MAVFPMQQILMNWAHLGCWKISLFLFSIPPLNQSMAIENTIWMGKKTESGDWWAGCTMNFFCWKYSRVETFLVTLRESDLMGLPVDRVAVPADIVKSHGKWCCNCQRKHNLPHVVDIHEIHNLLSMQWPLHQISVFIMGNMDCVMPSSPCLNLDSFSWRFDMFKFKRLPVSYHRNPPLTSVVLNPASVDLRCFARQCRDMSRVVISFCGLALATGPRLSQWGPGWHRGPNTHKSRLPPHTLQFLLASRYSKQHCIDIK